MLSKEYLDTARTLRRVAQTMTNQSIADRLGLLADDYEYRAGKALQAESELAPMGAGRERAGMASK